jgi:hypothetical protein
MTSRRNTSISAETFIHHVLARVKECRSFFQADLTSLVVESVPELEPSPMRDTNKSWESNFQMLLSWTSLALREREWLKANGLSKPNLGHISVRRHGTMRKFLSEEGLLEAAISSSNLQQGRKILRIEDIVGKGTALLLVPVLPMIRRVSRHEESRVTRMLASHQDVRIMADELSQLRQEYQEMHVIHSSKVPLHFAPIGVAKHFSSRIRPFHPNGASSCLCLPSSNRLSISLLYKSECHEWQCVERKLVNP